MRSQMKQIKTLSILLVILSLIGCTSEYNQNNEASNLNSDVDNVEKHNGELKQVDSSTLDNDESKVYLEVLKNEGYVVIDDYSIEMELNIFGDVKFISGFNMVKNLPQLTFFLIKDDSSIVYDFPEFEDYKSIYNNMISVSLEDVNGDGLKDIIVIGEFMKGHGAESGQLFPVVNIYFQLNDGFHQKSDVNEMINESKSIDSAEKVIEFFEVNNYEWNK